MKRGGKVHTLIVPDTKTATLAPLIRQSVKPDNVVYTDGNTRYDVLDVSEFNHLAKHGNKHARDTFAYLESDSEFGAPDVSPEAVQWWGRLAKEGDPLGQARTGLFYKDGRGVPKDGVVAYMWLILASEHGFTTGHSPDLSEMVAVQIAKDARSDLEKTLSPEQVAAAQKRAAAWHSTGSKN